MTGGKPEDRDRFEILVLAATKCLGELTAPDANNDSDELICRRFLCKGAVALIVGATGIGKSTFIMQLVIHLSVGREAFGFRVGSCYTSVGMRVLIVQSENDEADLVEMRDGVLASSTHLEERDKETAKNHIAVASLDNHRGPAFLRAIKLLAEVRGPFDLVVIDPAFAYTDADTNDAKAVGNFMREQLIRFAREHCLAVLLVHHIPKPSAARPVVQRTSTNSAYQGAGSGEFANAARAIITLAEESPGEFFLGAAKRGRRLGWVDADRQPCLKRRLTQSNNEGVSFWIDHGPVSTGGSKDIRKPGRKPELKLDELLNLVCLDEGKNQSSYKRNCAQRLGVSPNTIQNGLNQLESSQQLRSQKRGKQTQYFLTDAGLERVRSMNTAPVKIHQ